MFLAWCEKDTFDYSGDIELPNSPLLDYVTLVRGGSEIYSHRNYDDCKVIKIDLGNAADNNPITLLCSDCPYEDHGGWGNFGGMRVINHLQT